MEHLQGLGWRAMDLSSPPPTPACTHHQVHQHRQRQHQVGKVQHRGGHVPLRQAAQGVGEDLAAPHLSFARGGRGEQGTLVKGAPMFRGQAAQA